MSEAEAFGWLLVRVFVFAVRVAVVCGIVWVVGVSDMAFLSIVLMDDGK